MDFAILRLQQMNRHLVQSDRFNEVVHCMSAVTVLLESVEEFGTNHGPHATSVPSGAAGRPNFDIPQEQLQYLIDYEISVTKIAYVHKYVCKCIICSRSYIYHVKFTSYCELIECSRPIRIFIVSLMYNNMVYPSECFRRQ